MLLKLFLTFFAIFKKYLSHSLVNLTAHLLTKPQKLKIAKKLKSNETKKLFNVDINFAAFFIHVYNFGVCILSYAWH